MYLNAVKMHFPSSPNPISALFLASRIPALLFPAELRNASDSLNSQVHFVSSAAGSVRRPRGVETVVAEAVVVVARGQAVTASVIAKVAAERIPTATAAVAVIVAVPTRHTVHAAPEVAAWHEGTAGRRIIAATTAAAGAHSSGPADIASTAATTAAKAAAAARAHSGLAVGRAQKLGERVGVAAVLDQGRERATAGELGLGGGLFHGGPPPPHARVNEPVVHLGVVSRVRNQAKVSTEAGQKETNKAKICVKILKKLSPQKTSAHIAFMLTWSTVM